jgi:hypothetical protein
MKEIQETGVFHTGNFDGSGFHEIINTNEHEYKRVKQ